MAVLARDELEKSPLADLYAIASELGIEGYRRLRREALISSILGEPAGESPPAPAADEDSANGEEPSKERRPRRPRRSRRGSAAADSGEGAEATEDSGPAAKDEPDEPEAEREPDPEEVQRSGVLDILPGGSAFLRADPFTHSADDVYVSSAQIRRCELRRGDELTGPVRPPRRSERYPSLVRVEQVNGLDADPPAERAHFEDLTAVHATERLSAPGELDTVPFGKGSRVTISGPPGADVSGVLRSVATTLVEKHSDADLFVVLCGVGPEEVTDWRKAVQAPIGGGSFDRPQDELAQAAEMATERAKRVAERGGNAVVVIEGLDMLPPAVARRVFAAGRNTEEAGSVTLVAGAWSLGEALRFATTRIVLESAAGGKPSVSSALSGTPRADLLK